MNAKDKTEDVLKSIHILFSKAEPIEGSKKKVIIDRDRMMSLLKDLNDCMYAMMDEYEITKQSKERALRDIRKESDGMIFDARKSAEDIYAASIMYTDHAIDEIQGIIDKTQSELSDLHDKMKESIEERKKVLKDNQIDLKNNLTALIDTQKYLNLIENENNRLKREAEKKAEDPDWKEEPKEKVVPEIKINEEYFRAAGLMPEEDNDTENFPEEEVSLDPEDLARLDEEYFDWKEGGASEEDEQEEKRGFFGFGRKKNETV